MNTMTEWTSPVATTLSVDLSNVKFRSWSGFLMSDDSSRQTQQLRELVAEWRRHAERASSNGAPTTALNLDHCADEVEEILDGER